MESLPELGQMVYSRAGRDAGSALLVVGVCDGRHVLVADGSLRRASRPKRKNVRHLTVAEGFHAGLRLGHPVGDAEMRLWLASRAAGAAVGTGRDVGSGEGV